MKSTTKLSLVLFGTHLYEPRMNNWKNCKNILCVRPDNMGDIIMTGPALRALKETFGCRITLLTSQMGSLITPHIPEIDETIICTLPWVKSNIVEDVEGLQNLINQLKEKQFDAAIIFTVYSQNPLPTALLLFMADIPLRLAFCRENPYQLLTHWLPDEEPYNFIRHQVERDLALVQFIGASVNDNCLQLTYNTDAIRTMQQKLQLAGVAVQDDFIILHPGVSEKKREVPVALWVEATALLQKATSLQLIITGAENEKGLASSIQQQAAGNIINAAGLFSIEEFIAVVASAKAVVCVNTATTHIAAAVQTPVVVLYALTNPQHYPWTETCEILTFSITEAVRSSNQVVKYVSKHCMEKNKSLPTANEVVKAVMELLKLPNKKAHPDKARMGE